ncbi:bifunctional metallophosphatase/5'-nucleotidase, partial [Butyricimonas sp.]|uniref:bifunctional metallophosphatase/5'-nucleotidase n=1 Tax=Butyricimonas sp. TaxID=1969738 RepID=UPI001B29DAD1
IISLMNDLGYEVGTLGNHEFDFGQKILRARINDATFPIICANINSSRGELDSIPPYYIIEKDGIKLGFIGLVQTETDQIPSTNPERLKDITFDHYLDKVEDYKPLKRQCDVLIGLTHLGVDKDSILATQMPELDIIIGGHTHTLLETSKEINNVIIGQTGLKLQYAGLTILKFTKGKLTERSYQSCLIDTITRVDSCITRKVNYFMEQPEFKEVIGISSLPFKSQESIGNIVTDAMLRSTVSDFAFYNQGGIRLSALPQGDITLETLLSIEPFGNHIVLHDLSLSDIKALILNRFNQDGHVIDLYVSPGSYTIIQDQQGKGTDVILKDRNGRPLVEKASYKVALNNYVSIQYDFLDKGKGLHTDISIVNAMVDFIRANTPLVPTNKRTYLSTVK